MTKRECRMMKEWPKSECQICVNLCNLRMIISVISASSVVKNNFAA